MAIQANSASGAFAPVVFSRESKIKLQGYAASTVSFTPFWPWLAHRGQGGPVESYLLTHACITLRFVLALVIFAKPVQ